MSTTSLWQAICFTTAATALALSGGCSDSSDPSGGSANDAGEANGGEPPGGRPSSSGGRGGSSTPSAGATGDAAGAPSSEGGSGGAPDSATGGVATGGTATGAAGADPSVGGAGGTDSVAGAGGAGGDGAGGPFEGCDYVEQDDLGNDADENGITPEDTKLMLTRPLTLCGRLDADHFDGEDADIDRFTFYQDELLSDLIFRLRLEGSGGSAEVGMQFSYTWSEAVSGKAVISQEAFGPELRVAVAALGAPLDEPLFYRLRIDFDAPDERCPRVTTPANYVESNDGAAHDGNDVYTNDNVAFFFTPGGGDAPEPTNLTIAAGSAYRLSGTAGDVSPIGNYFDADTFAIHTGPTTDQLTIRMDWASTTTDFDYLLARGGSERLQAGGTDAGTTREFHTFTVAPDTTYWLWVAPYIDSEGLPLEYDVSIYGETFEL